MKITDIKIGEFYRIKGNSFAWAKAVQIIPPKTPPNTTRSTVVKCEFLINKTDKTGLIKYFKASDLEKRKGDE